jgi:heme/copper-type cytochrome/quinol oxidase subunit 3
VDRHVVAARTLLTICVSEAMFFAMLFWHVSSESYSTGLITAGVLTANNDGIVSSLIPVVFTNSAYVAVDAGSVAQSVALFSDSCGNHNFIDTTSTGVTAAVPSVLSTVYGSLVLFGSGFLFNLYPLQRSHSLVVLMLAVFTLGAIFVFGQYLEYSDEVPFNISTAVSYGGFYLVTGLHGSHVVIGLILIAGLAVSLAMASLSQNMSSRLVSSYWHLVDGM